MPPEIGFKPLELSDGTLVYLQKLAVAEGVNRAPIFGEWMCNWCQTETMARRNTPGERKEKHAIGLPQATDWTDPELADALMFVTIMSYQPGIPADASTFVDRLSLCMARLAADRLRERVAP